MVKFTLPAFYSADLGVIYNKCEEKFWQNYQNIYEIGKVK